MDDESETDKTQRNDNEDISVREKLKKRQNNIPVRPYTDSGKFIWLIYSKPNSIENDSDELSLHTLDKANMREDKQDSINLSQRASMPDVNPKRPGETFTNIFHESWHLSKMESLAVLRPNYAMKVLPFRQKLHLQKIKNDRELFHANRLITIVLVMYH